MHRTLKTLLAATALCAATASAVAQEIKELNFGIRHKF